MLMRYNDQFKKLDDVGFIGRGKSKHRPRNDESLYGGNYPFVQTGDVRKAEYYLTEYSQTYNDKGLAQSKLWNEGTLCITIAANIAETAVLGIKACFPDSIIGFIPDEKKADVRFIKYCLETYKIQMQSISQGATQDNLSLEKLRSINFSIPKLKIQQNIAEVLYSYDKLIENNTKRISILDKIAEQLYKEWFVRMRFPGYEKAKFVKGIPEGWFLKKAKSIFNINIGKTPPRSQPKWFTNNGQGTKWVSISDLSKSSLFVYSTNEEITSEGVARHNMRIAKRNTVILSFKLSVGKVAITACDMVTNEAIAHFNKSKDYSYVNKEYTYLYLKNFAYAELGNTSSIGIALNSKIIKDMPFVIPARELLEDFERIVLPLFNNIDQLNLQNNNLRKTRDLLLPRLISGKLQIKTQTKELIKEMHT